MRTYVTISPALQAIIPKFQLIVTMKAPKEHAAALERLEIALKLCPKIGATDRSIEHPAIFHYFYGGSDFFICEYEPKDGQMFGFGILNGDLQNSEWGYFNALEFAQSQRLNIDYHFPVQTIEAALYTAYPNYYKKPQSLM